MRMAGARAGAGAAPPARSARSALGAPARRRAHGSGPGRRGARCRPREGAGRGRRGPRRAGPVVVRLGGDRVRRPHGRRARRRQPARDLGAGPGGGPRRRRSGRRGRVRARPRHGVPRRRGCRRHRDRPVAGHGRRGPAPVPRRHLRGRRPAPADAAHLGRRLVGRARVVLADPPRRLRAARRRRRAGPSARARRPAGARPCTRGRTYRTSTSGSSNAIDLDFVLHDPEDVAAVVRAAGLVDVEWYLRSPFEGKGETTQRLYVVGRAPA